MKCPILHAWKLNNPVEQDRSFKYLGIAFHATNICRVCMKYVI